jgi:hypothetical protein
MILCDVDGEKEFVDSDEERSNSLAVDGKEEPTCREVNVDCKTNEAEAADLPAEEWKSLPDIPEHYQISSLGRARSRLGVLKQIVRPDGYISVTMHVKKGKRVSFLAHRLVALAFLPNPSAKRCVNHLDKNRQNNKVTNLEWVTAKENMMHEAKDRRDKRLAVRVWKEKTLVATFDNRAAVAEYYGVTLAVINNWCCRGSGKGLRFEVLNKLAPQFAPQVLEWRTAESDKYEVSACGLIRSKLTKAIRRTQLLNGYPSVSLQFGKKKQTVTVHRQVALAWVKQGSPSQTVVNHKDGNRLNNNFINLEWVTHAENSSHAAQELHQDKPRPGSKPIIRINTKTKEEVTFCSIAEAARAMNLPSIRCKIGAVISGDRTSTCGFFWKTKE